MLDTLVAELDVYLWAVAAIFLRIGPAISIAPGYGESFVSPRVKLVLALMVSVAAMPVLQPYLPDEPLRGRDIALFAVRETLFGFFLGILSRCVIFLLEIAGQKISQMISLSQMLGNAVEPMPVISHILVVTGLALIFSTTLGDQIIWSFLSSYVQIDISLEDIVAIISEVARTLISFVFNQAFVLASGFISLFLLYYLYSGFVNKAMPQFMVSFIGVPFVALFSIFFLLKHYDFLLNSWQLMAVSIIQMTMDGLQ